LRSINDRIRLPIDHNNRKFDVVDIDGQGAGHMERIRPMRRDQQRHVQPDSSYNVRQPLARTEPWQSLHRTLGNTHLSSVLQPKLTVSHPTDIYEQQADRVADEVMRMPASAVGVERTVGPHIQRLCPGCEDELKRQPLEEEEEPLQTKALLPGSLLQRQAPEEEELLQPKTDPDSTPDVSPESETAIHALSGRGQPLSDSVRSFMEPRFHTDFSAVRLHTDASAHDLARSVNAQAFTVGTNIVFGAGHYDPASERGKHLLAHELTHVVQQGQGSGSSALQKQSNSEPEESTAKAQKAANEAESLRQQQAPCIWFDSWSNDRRDNDRDGKIDEGNEQQSDGIHYPISYKGRLCDNDESLETTDTTCRVKDIKVHYRVCIDIPRAAYAAAAIPFPQTRSVVTAMQQLHNRYTRSWKVLMYNGVRDPAFNGTLLKGDFVAERHGNEWLGHSGIALSGSEIVHLPGPSRGLSAPSACNDIVKDNGFGHTFAARPKV
jgi:hypothetical protein